MSSDEKLLLPNVIDGATSCLSEWAWPVKVQKGFFPAHKRVNKINVTTEKRRETKAGPDVSPLEDNWGDYDCMKKASAVDSLMWK